MQHYHIVWGPINSKSPSVLNFSDREEALSKFEEIGRAVEETEKFPNLPHTATKSDLDSKTMVIKLETYQTRICFIYCGHECDNKNPNELTLN